MRDLSPLELAKLLVLPTARASPRAVLVLTGAGVSTESGLPDYRGVNGLYARPDAKPPMSHQEFVSSEARRQRFWARSMLGWGVTRASWRPNPAHTALAELERALAGLNLVTQNVDRLHHAAGSQRVVELHGRGDLVECMSCGLSQNRGDYQQMLRDENGEWMERAREAIRTPGGGVALRPDGDAEFTDEVLISQFKVCGCPRCGSGVMKPAFVFFGGTVPPRVAEIAGKLAEEAEVMLVVGTTASTWSARRLLHKAAGNGRGCLIGVVNQGPAEHLVPFAEAGLGWHDGACGAFLQELKREVGRATGEHAAVALEMNRHPLE